MPICQRYLIQGAYGYFGSSTIAYGPEEGNGAADLITQYFLMAVLDGASLGRAALVARQRFVQQTAELDPVDLKTLGQFNLLGDPSIHPATVTRPRPAFRRASDTDQSNRQAAARTPRQAAAHMGEFLQEHQTDRVAQGQASSQVGDGPEGACQHRARSRDRSAEGIHGV